MTGDWKPDERRALLRHGVSDWLEKPFEIEELLAALTHALEPAEPTPDWPELLAESAFTLCDTEFTPLLAHGLHSDTLGNQFNYASEFSVAQLPQTLATQDFQASSAAHLDTARESLDWDVAIIPISLDAFNPTPVSLSDLAAGNGANTAPAALPATLGTVLTAEPAPEAPASEPFAPPFPGSQPGLEILNPPWMAGLLLSDVRTETPRLRLDLLPPEQAGQAWLYQAGKYCLKTSQQHCFTDADTANLYLDAFLQDHAALDELHPDDTFFVLTPDARGCYWLWTISPWLVTLEGELAEAVAQNDEVALAASLCKFAEAVQCSLQLALEKRLLLGVHPANFASTYAGGPLVYINEGIERGYCLPDIGQALLARVTEYAAWPQALGVYLDVLGVGISHRFNREQVRQLDLLRAVRDVPAESESLRAAQAQLIERIRQCPA